MAWSLTACNVSGAGGQYRYVSRGSEQSERPDRFERIFSDCYDAVFRYAARRVAAEAVQDVVSETFLVAWRRYEELKGDPVPWLLGIARRVAANQRRAGARRDALQQRLRVHPADPVGLEVAAHDRRLAAALEALGERDREALMLVVWDGLQHRDAARVMGCSTGALTVRVHRARRRLARALTDEEPARIAAIEGAGSLR
ncbi:MAG: RNA polymerase sigma factor [Solirubrobacteraceae bacterium]